MARYTKEGYSGVSSQTKKGLLDSGAMDKSDFGISTPKPIVKSVIPKDATRQVDQSEYNRLLKQEKSKADANYQKYKAGGFDRSKNLGKYLHKSRGK